MTFINPGFLWVLPAAALPVLIYYLMRFRSLKVEWGATYVLERVLEKLKKKLYWDQVILLALRTLACVALVLAFARPSSSGAAGTVSGSGMHRVILVDASYSMLAGEPGRARWERGKEVLKRLTATWGRGEKWSLARVAERVEWLVDGEAIEDAQASAARIDALKPAEARVEWAKALESVFAKLASEPGVELYFCADDQAASWARAEALRLPPNFAPRAYWIVPPLEEPSNLAVTEVRLAGDVSLAGHASPVFARVQNFGTRDVEHAEMEWLVDGAFAAKEAFSLRPGQSGWVQGEVIFDRAGSHYVTARVGADALDLDNRFSAGVEVVEQLNVLVLRDPGRTRKFDSSWDFLKIAGQSEKLNDKDDAPVFTLGPLVFSVHEGPLDEAALREKQVVVVDGASGLAPEAAARLRTFVQAGGGLLLSADDAVDAQAWNALLGDAGLLPSPLRAARLEQVAGERFQTLAAPDPERAAFRALSSAERGDLAEARFYSWFELDEPAEDARIPLRFADGLPFLVLERRDPGAVVQLAAGLNGRVNNLPVREFFFPFLFRLCTEAAAGAYSPRTVDRAAPVRLRLPGAAGLRGVTLHSEGREPLPMTLQPAPQGFVAQSAGAPEWSGLYAALAVRETSTEKIWIGVQGPRADSDLAPLGTEARAELVQALGLAEAPDWDRLDELLRASRGGAEWHHWVVLALLALLVGELLMERRFL
ncbi:MAG: BatA domain-containing protein [Planctomycetota bacterium]|nr:BatA domain-containing protein [Planctomycetota bacterium]